MKNIKIKETPDTASLKFSTSQYTVRLNYKSFSERNILNMVNEKYKLNNDTLIGGENGFDDLCYSSTSHNTNSIFF